MLNVNSILTRTVLGKKAASADCCKKSISDRFLNLTTDILINIRIFQLEFCLR